MVAEQDKTLSGPLEHLGLALKVLRTRADLTQQQLSDRARVTKAQVSNYERGKEMPKLPSLDRILTALGVTSLHHLADALEEVQQSAEWMEAAADWAGPETGDTTEVAARRAAALRGLRHSFELYLQAVEDAVRRGSD